MGNGVRREPRLWARRLVAYIYFMPVLFGIAAAALLAFAMHGVPTEATAGSALAASGLAALLGNLSYNLSRALTDKEDKLSVRRLILAGSLLAYASILLAVVALLEHAAAALLGKGPFTNIPMMGGWFPPESLVTLLAIALLDSFCAAVLLAFIGLFHLCVALSCRHFGIRDVPLSFGRRAAEEQVHEAAEPSNAQRDQQPGGDDVQSPGDVEGMAGAPGQDLAQGDPAAAGPEGR